MAYLLIYLFFIRLWNLMSACPHVRKVLRQKFGDMPEKSYLCGIKTAIKYDERRRKTEEQ